MRGDDTARAGRRAAPGGTRSPGRSRRSCSPLTSSSRCSGCCGSTPPPTTWPSSPSTSSSCPSCTAPVVDVLAPGYNLNSAITSRSRSVCSPRSSASFRRRPRCCSSRRWRRGVGVPGGHGGLRADRAGDGAADRLRLRLLLGPAADDLLRLPRDRPGRAAARVLAVGAGPPPARGGDRLGGAAGVRQGGPGVHRRRDRRCCSPAAALFPGCCRPVRVAGPGSARPAWLAAARRDRAVGRAVPRGVGPVLVGVRDHRDHPALQPAPRLLLLEERRRRRRRAGLLRRHPARPDGARLAGQAGDGRAAAAADRVRRARLAGRAARAAQPGAAVHLDQPGVLGHRLALQRDAHADPVHRRGRGHRPLAARAALAWPRPAARPVSGVRRLRGRVRLARGPARGRPGQARRRR